ncbi:hypothetical protein AOA80_03635 [Methanomassiliicoccales archaeon RumEn M1]|nr:hypothetical protein AOA80_03635 [Methanomassiliicoccales archaeon RumEn M1]
MSVALLATLSMSPAVTYEAEAKAWFDEGTEQAIYWWLRVLPVTSQMTGVYEYLTLDKSVSPPPAGNDDAVKAYARDVDALRSAEHMYNIYGISASLVRTDTETWKLSAAYLNRAAEIGAGSLWYEGAVFDADAILEYSSIYESIGNGNRNTQEILDEAVRVSADLKSAWSSTSYGGPLNIELTWNGGSTGACNERLALDFMTLATASADRNIVYLTKTATKDAPDTARTIWAYTTTGSITPIAPGAASMPLSLGANDVGSLPSGFYKLSPGVYGGPFVSAVGEDAAPVKGSAGIIKDNEYGYITAQGDGVSVYWKGAASASSTLDFKITGSSDVQTSLNAPLELVSAYASYMDRLTALLYESASAAQVMWTISAKAHQSNMLLSPSSIIPHLTNVNVSPEQAYALYVLALDQISQYNTNHGELLKDGVTKISAQSLDLYCQGSIYAADGTAIAENVIFTPYIYVKDWTLYSGSMNTMTQDGLAMVWDNGETAVGWGGPSTTDTYASLVLDKGAYMSIDEIHYKGELVPSLKLDVVSVEQIDVFKGIEWDRQDPPKVMDASTLIMIILLEAAAIVLLVGYIIGRYEMYIVALVIAIVALVASEWVARIALGMG